MLQPLSQVSAVQSSIFFVMVTVPPGRLLLLYTYFRLLMGLISEGDQLIAGSYSVQSLTYRQTYVPPETHCQNYRRPSKLALTAIGFCISAPKKLLMSFPGVGPHTGRLVTERSTSSTGSGGGYPPRPPRMAAILEVPQLRDFYQNATRGCCGINKGVKIQVFYRIMGMM
ncbi:hypothetical protein BD779DRAFT_219936 [Infundibulicybe gibba]|nr:hypothetical protein BD779DRAFT_219936 [Infundibulicybe gibba]